MKQLLSILLLGTSLAGAVNVSGVVRQPVDRSAINSASTSSAVSRETETATETATPEETEITATPTPECVPPEFYDPELDRCRLADETLEPPTDIPTETPPWSDDIQATMDADPYDNDYGFVGICFEYVDGGTRIIYFPCELTPEATDPSTGSGPTE